MLVLWCFGTAESGTYCTGDDDSLASEINVVGVGAYDLAADCGGEYVE
jgi:hypothetical protein